MSSQRQQRTLLLVVLLLWTATSCVVLGRRFRVRMPAPHARQDTVTTDTATMVRNPQRPSARQHQLAQLQRVYCSGALLHEVQMSGLFPDSKHFVDMPIKSSSSVDELLLGFSALQAGHGVDASEETATSWKEQLEAFVDRHFDPPGAELVPTTPLDFHEGKIPPQIAKIASPELQAWALELHELWKRLARVPVGSASDGNVQSSFLHALPIPDADSGVRHPLGRQFHGQNVLMVPGGRFRESYYWDSYWIVQGLLVSGLHQTARGVVNHLLEYVNEFGFVPNGGRVYYLTRSQPPMLSDMVRLVARRSGNASDNNSNTEEDWDLPYLQAVVPLLEREYRFWMTRGDDGHAVEIPAQSSSEALRSEPPHVLNRYTAQSGAPRPESYREDFRAADTAFGSASEATEEKENFYNEIIAAAESGWDFSSRWLADNATLATAHTSRVVPVELNAILHCVEHNLATFYALLGDMEASTRFEDAAQSRVRAMDSVLWSDTHGCWKDYLLDSQTHSNVVAISDYSPLWAKAFDPKDTKRLRSVVASLERSGLVQEGGVETTTTVTGQQWDAPNAWPPLQDIVVEGLLAVDTVEARLLAERLVRTWVKAGLVAWHKTGLMFEKYNAQQLGGVGDGGEYTPQFGFGWSNGVILAFLTKYQDLLEDMGEGGAA